MRAQDSFSVSFTSVRMIIPEVPDSNLAANRLPRFGSKPVSVFDEVTKPNFLYANALCTLT